MDIFTNSLTLIDAVLYNSAGLILIVLGALVLIRMTGFPDLTIDGSFTIGAVVYAVVASSGFGAILGFVAAVLAGTVAGLNTWFINTKLGVGKVVSGVLSMIILVLLAPYISGGSTQSLLNADTIHKSMNSIDRDISQVLINDIPYQLHFLTIGFWLLIVAISCMAVSFFMKSNLGIRLRYLGSANNPTLLNTKTKLLTLALGLGFGNGLVALGGAIEAEKRGGFTVNMGTGIILVALAAMVLGESLLKSYRKRDHLYLSESIIAVFLGCIVYSIGIQFLLKLNIAFVDLRLLTALFLLALLGFAGRYHSSSTKLF